MAISRGQLKGQILRNLNKTDVKQGFYTDEKIQDAIQDSLDFISVEMFMAGEGWLTKIAYVDTVAGQATYAMPPNCAIINQVRYLVGALYLPVIYDDGEMQAQASSLSGVTQFPCRYRIVENKIYFSPPPGNGGPANLQIEYAHYPDSLVSDGQLIDAQFDNGLINYVKWRASSILASQIGKTNKEWEKFEDQWYGQMIKLTNKKVRSPTTIRSFME